MTNDELTGYVRMFHGNIYRLALGYTRNAEDAEDICQNAFIKLLDFKGRFDAPENCKAWLIRVTINLSKNYIRSKRSAQITELDEAIPALEPREYELLETVMSLPPKYRAVIHLFYYEGYSVKEIAGIVGSTVTTVTTRLARARERLKELLSREERI